MDSWKRPKINIPKTKLEWILDMIGYTAYVGTIILLVVVWSKLPAEVPAHYNAAGEVDRWGSKGELLILPLTGLFIIPMMQIFEKYPEWHNYPKRLNEGNAPQFYLHSRKMINQVKNTCLLLFSGVLFESISISLGWSDGLGAWFLPGAMLIVFLPVGVGIYQQRQIK